jgi:hypothetical protein
MTTMTEAEKAHTIVNAVKIFETGCSNTLHGSPPEDCRECTEAFLDTVASAMSGELRIPASTQAPPELRPEPTELTMNYDTKALDELKRQLAKPVGCEDGWTNPDHFDPWEAFPCIYGSYSSAFDEMAILVLDNLVQRKFGRDGGESLAHEMFREMLCVADLCDYGTSPRGCFPVAGFAEILPALLEKWREYARIAWSD